MNVLDNPSPNSRPHDLPDVQGRPPKIRKCRYCTNPATKGRLCYPHYLAVNHKNETALEARERKAKNDLPV